MRKHIAPLFVAVLTVCLAMWTAGTATAESGMKGWEIDSEYNKLYNPKEFDDIKGDIVKFVEVKPLPGMAPGTAFVLDEGGGETVVVHVCPESFASGREIGLRRGDWVKVKGVWADVGDETVFIASKIKKDGGFVFKVRLTSDGTPFWTMTPAQLAKEQASE